MCVYYRTIRQGVRVRSPPEKYSFPFEGAGPLLQRPTQIPLIFMGENLRRGI